MNNEKVDGKIIIGKDKQLSFIGKDISVEKVKNPRPNDSKMPSCPKCKNGNLIKGKSAYGCSLWKTGCDFRYAFEDIKKKAAGQKLTKDLVLKIISSKI